MCSEVAVAMSFMFIVQTQLVLPFAAPKENMYRRLTPKLLHTIHTQEITHFIAGASVPKIVN